MGMIQVIGMFKRDAKVKMDMKKEQGAGCLGSLIRICKREKTFKTDMANEQSENRVFPFNELPEEIAMLILNMIPLKVLCRKLLVSKSFASMIYRIKTVYLYPRCKDVDMMSSQTISLILILREILSSTKEEIPVIVGRLSNLETVKFTFKFFSSLVKFKNLKSIHVKFLSRTIGNWYSPQMWQLICRSRGSMVESVVAMVPAFVYKMSADSFARNQLPGIGNDELDVCLLHFTYQLAVVFLLISLESLTIEDYRRPPDEIYIGCLGSLIRICKREKTFKTDMANEQSENRVFPFNELPEEIAMLILNMIPLKVLCRKLLVSKSFASMIYRIETVYLYPRCKDVDMMSSQTISLILILREILSSTKEEIPVIVGRLSNHETVKFTFKFFSSLVKFKNLKSIHVKFLSRTIGNWYSPQMWQLICRSRGPMVESVVAMVPAFVYKMSADSFARNQLPGIGNDELDVCLLHFTYQLGVVFLLISLESLTIEDYRRPPDEIYIGCLGSLIRICKREKTFKTDIANEQSENRVFPFNELPEEIAMLILNMIPLKVLCRKLLVSKSFASMIYRIETVYLYPRCKDVDMMSSQTISLILILREILSSTKEEIPVIVGRLSNLETVKFTFKFFSSLVKFKNLKSIHVKFLSRTIGNWYSPQMWQLICRSRGSMVESVVAMVPAFVYKMSADSFARNQLPGIGNDELDVCLLHFTYQLAVVFLLISLESLTIEDYRRPPDEIYIGCLGSLIRICKREKTFKTDMANDQSENRVFPFNELPEEIAMLILNMIPLKVLCRKLLVSKSFASMIYRIETVYLYPRCKDVDMSCKDVDMMSSQTISLILILREILSSTKEEIPVIVGRLSNLETVKFTFKFFSSLVKFKNLKSIHVKFLSRTIGNWYSPQMWQLICRSRGSMVESVVAMVPAFVYKMSADSFARNQLPGIGNDELDVCLLHFTYQLAVVFLLISLESLTIEDYRRPPDEIFFLRGEQLVEWRNILLFPNRGVTPIYWRNMWSDLQLHSSTKEYNDLAISMHYTSEKEMLDEAVTVYKKRDWTDKYREKQWTDL